MNMVLSRWRAGWPGQHTGSHGHGRVGIQEVTGDALVLVDGRALLPASIALATLVLDVGLPPAARASLPDRIGRWWTPLVRVTYAEMVQAWGRSVRELLARCFGARPPSARFLATTLAASAALALLTFIGCAWLWSTTPTEFLEH